MEHALSQIARQWRLSAAEQRLFSGAARRVGPKLLADCCDIDRALRWLLGDDQLVCRWLRVPQPPLYHAPPLGVIFGSGIGRRWLRRQLLREAATAQDEAAEARLAMDEQ